MTAVYDLESHRNFFRKALNEGVTYQESLDAGKLLLSSRGEFLAELEAQPRSYLAKNTIYREDDSVSNREMAEEKLENILNALARVQKKAKVKEGAGCNGRD